MKHLFSIFISIGISLVISISFVGCGTTSKNESNESGKVSELAANDVNALKQKAVESYKTLLSGMYGANKGAEDSLYFFMRDLDADGVEELLVRKWPQTTVYTFDGTLKILGKDDAVGTTRWMYSENTSYPGIFYSHLGGGRVHYYYFTVKSGKLIDKRLWNEDYSGVVEALDLEHEKIIEFTEDKQMIEESKIVFEKNQELKFKKVNKKNINKLN